MIGRDDYIADSNGSKFMLIVKFFAATATICLFLANNVVGSDRLKKCESNQVATVEFKTAALSGLNDLLDKAQKNKDVYGFKADDRLNKAVLGEPIPIYTVNDVDAFNYRAGQKVEPLLKESGRWLVPVNINGSYRTFVEVFKTATNTFDAKTGSLTAARVWKTIIKRWPPEQNFHPRLVVCQRIPGYFFTIPEVDPQNMTDIVHIVSEIDKPATLSSAAVILHSW